MAGPTTARAIASRTAVVFSILASFAAARSIPAGETIDPFKDPKDDPFNPLHYIANNGLTAMAVGEYHVPSVSVRPKSGAESGSLYRQGGLYQVFQS